MRIHYSCARCRENLLVELDKTVIRQDPRNDVQDYDIQDFDCPKCGHSNLIKIFLEVE